jgi:hypothetical protein
MRASTAFFVGMGTVGLAIVGGLGGGLMIGNMMSPAPAKHGSEAARAEPRTPPPMSSGSAFPYTAATLAFTDPSIDRKATSTDHRTDGGAPPAPAAEAAASTEAPAAQALKPADHTQQPTQEMQQAPSAKQVTAPEDAYAKARDSDVKHAADKRRAERAQRWAGRHNYDHARDQDQARDQYQDDGQRPNGNSDQQARDDRNDDRGPANYSYSHSGRVYRDDGRGRYRAAERDDDDRGPHYFVDERPRFGFPGIQLFGPDD